MDTSAHRSTGRKRDPKRPGGSQPATASKKHKPSATSPAAHKKPYTGLFGVAEPICSEQRSVRRTRKHSTDFDLERGDTISPSPPSSRSPSPVKTPCRRLRARRIVTDSESEDDTWQFSREESNVRSLRTGEASQKTDANKQEEAKSSSNSDRRRAFVDLSSGSESVVDTPQLDRSESPRNEELEAPLVTEQEAEQHTKGIAEEHTSLDDALPDDQGARNSLPMAQDDVDNVVRQLIAIGKTKDELLRRKDVAAAELQQITRDKALLVQELNELLEGVARVKEKIDGMDHIIRGKQGTTMSLNEQIQAQESQVEQMMEGMPISQVLYIGGQLREEERKRAP